jgi:hypothetical protein
VEALRYSLGTPGDLEEACLGGPPVEDLEQASSHDGPRSDRKTADGLTRRGKATALIET